MENDENIERSYSFNWMSLLIKVVIFAILLVLLIWILSKFAGGSKKCKTVNQDYYIISTFNDNQYNTKGDQDKYTYNYTLKLLDISEDNSKDVSVAASNYFHTDSEYKEYLKDNNNVKIINQSNNDLVVDNVNSLKKSSLTAGEFIYEISDIYVFDGEYYIDVTLSIGDHSNISAYSNNYFVPIHLNVEYTQTSNCKAK